MEDDYINYYNKNSFYSDKPRKSTKAPNVRNAGNKPLSGILKNI